MKLKIDAVKLVADEISGITATATDLQAKYQELVQAIANSDDQVLEYLEKLFSKNSKFSKNSNS